MKNVICLLLLFSLVSNTAFGACDWSKDITPGPNKTFIYTEECHQKVGDLVQDARAKEQQVQDLSKAIQLKDLAIKDSDARASNWSNTSRDLEERLQKIDSAQKTNEYLAFGLGFLGAILTAWAASKLVHP